MILALGTRLSQGTTGWNYNVINPDTQILQVDIDPREIGRNYPVTVGIVGMLGRWLSSFSESFASNSQRGERIPSGEAG